MRRQFGILAPLRVRLFPGLSGLFGPMGLPLHLKTPFRLPALSHQRSLSAHERSYQYYSVSRKCIQSDNAGLSIYKIIILMIIGRVHNRNYQCPEIFRSLAHFFLNDLKPTLIVSGYLNGQGYSRFFGNAFYLEYGNTRSWFIQSFKLNRLSKTARKNVRNWAIKFSI